MPDDLYTRDILLWSEQQADLLRRLSAGERLNETIDWANVVEEILDVGSSHFSTCRSLIEQVLVHLLKLQIAPGHQAAKHWRVEILAYWSGIATHWTPSMEQRVDLAPIYRRAVRRATGALADLPDACPTPATCPFTVPELIDPDADIDALSAKLARACSNR